MSAFHLLPLRPQRTSLAVQLLNLGLLAWIVAWVWWVSRRRLGLDPWAAAAATIATALCAPLAIWSLQGADVGFVAAWLVPCVALLARERAPGERSEVPLLWALSLGMLIRPDVTVFYVAAVVTSARWSGDPKRHLLHGAAALAVIWGGLLLFNQLYYGDLLPNTYYLKATGAPRSLVLSRGVTQLATWLPGAVPALALAVAAFALGRAQSGVTLSAVLVGVAIAYDVWVGGDWATSYGSRFLAPALPLLLMLTAVGADQALARLGSARFAASASGRGVVLAVAVGSGVLLNPSAARREWLDPAVPTMFKRYNAKNYVSALYFRDFTFPSTSIAVHWGGALPYFSQRPAIDVLGKSDRHIAKLVVDRFTPGHSKWDWDYVMNERKPDIIDIPTRGLEGHAAFREHYYYVGTREKGGVGFYIRKSSLDKLTDPDVYLVDHATGEPMERHPQRER